MNRDGGDSGPLEFAHRGRQNEGFGGGLTVENCNCTH
jgi:hypothetical protein